MSTRKGGVSDGQFGLNMSFHVGDRQEAVEANRRRFFSGLGIDQSALAIPRQCHTSRVEAVSSPGSFDSTDALITNRSGLWLTVSVADCVPVFLADAQNRAVAVAHAGWRGSSAGIVSNVVRRMQSAFGSRPADLVAFIGPSAGVCCYEIGDDVARKFSPRALRQKGDKKHLDLKSENRSQLMDCGVPNDGIEVSSLCTICNPDLHSFRRDRERSGRMLGVIGIVEN